MLLHGAVGRTPTQQAAASNTDGDVGRSSSVTSPQPIGGAAGEAYMA